MGKGDRKGSGVPSLRAATKQSSVSFLDCHGAKAPRNDGLSPGQVAPARLFLTKGLTGVPDIEQGSFQTIHRKSIQKFNSAFFKPNAFEAE